MNCTPAEVNLQGMKTNLRNRDEPQLIVEQAYSQAYSTRSSIKSSTNDLPGDNAKLRFRGQPEHFLVLGYPTLYEHLTRGQASPFYHHQDAAFQHGF